MVAARGIRRCPPRGRERRLLHSRRGRQRSQARRTGRRCPPAWDSARALHFAVCVTGCGFDPSRPGPSRRLACPRVPGSSTSSSSQAHLTASARFRVRAPAPTSGRLTATTRWRTGDRSRFPAAFQPPHSLLGHPIPARELGPPHGRLTEHATARSDPDGVTAFRTHELRPGWAPSVPRGGGAHPGPGPLPGRRLPLLRGQSPHPAPASHRARPCLTRHLPKVHTCSPVRSSPRRWPPGWNGPPLGFPPGFAPRRPGAGQRTPGRRQAIGHGPGPTRSTRNRRSPIR
jgi:hypothetical protein